MNRINVALFFILFSSAMLAQEEKISTGSERLAEWEKHQMMVVQSPFKSLPWIQIGPLLNSGRIAGIVGVPGNNDIIYASATVGGVWKTINAGTTWVPVFENQPTQTIGDIEVCPTNPDLVWVGTGSSNLSGSAYPGLGVFKSSDGGETWEHKGLEECQHVMRIAIAPDNPDLVYVAAMGNKYYPEEETIGLYKTVDGGETWHKVLSDDRYTGCADVVFHPANSNILFATTWNRKETKGYVYKTTDGGENWVKLTDGLPDGENIGRIGVDVSLTNTDVVYVYLNNHNRIENETLYSGNARQNKIAEDKKLSLQEIRKMSNKKFLATDSTLIAGFLRSYGIIRSFDVNEIKQMIERDEHTTKSLCDCIEKYWINENGNERRGAGIGGEVYRSDDGGKTWNKTHKEPLYLLSSFGWSFCDIKVSPVDENEIYILGVTLQHSNDGGKTFQANEGNQVHIVPNISKFLHLDQHDIWLDPLNPNRILLGNDGGTFISYDKGLNWMHHNTIPIGMFYKISVDMEEPYNIYGGTQDDSHVYGPSDQNLAYNTGEKWNYVWLDRWSGGDGLHIMPDITDPNIVYYESQNGALRRKNLAENKNVFIRPERDFCEPALRNDWSTPIYVSPTEENAVYYGANRLFKSANRGNDWVGISPDLTKEAEEGKKQNDRLSSIAIDNGDPKLIYTGSDAGVMHVTKDGGSAWNLVGNELPDTRVNSIKISEHKAGTVYIALSGNNADRNPYLYMSTDWGETWKSINGNLPIEKTRCITEDPVREEVLYAGTEKGVYVSLNNGDEWFSLSHGLPAASVDDILVHPRENELVIGTYGRGIYKMDITPFQQLTTEIMKQELYLFNIKDATLPKSRDSAGDWFFETARYPVFVFYMKTPGKVTAEIKDESGEIVRTLENTGVKGLNRIEWDMVRTPAKYARSAYKSGTELYGPGTYTIKISGNNNTIYGTFIVKDFN